jgi:DNA ligase-1
MSTFKPLLAANADLDKIKYPVLASPKLDGIRTIMLNGKAVTRSLKPIPNEHIRKCLEEADLGPLDGEIIVGDPTDPECFNRTTSAVMSRKGEPEFTYWAFDHVSELAFKDRLAEAHRLRYFGPVWLESVFHCQINDKEQLDAYESNMVAQGYEGIMLRDPIGSYKFGRSTVNEGILLKVKRFRDIDATIVGFEEQMHNANEAKESLLGYTERSSAKSGMVPMGTLGALVCSAKEFTETFNVGTGFTQSNRLEIWNNRQGLLGKTVKIKYQECGTIDRPRIPVFLGFRED